MTISEATIQAERSTSYAPARMPIRGIAIGATVVLVALVTLVALVQSAGHESVRPTPQPASESRDDIVRDLVNRGLVPSPTRQPAQPVSQSRDDIVHDLVTRGLVPAATLQTAPLSRDEIVRDLVTRGLVPAATLDD